MEQRKQLILESTISHYISTAEPVSSKVLSEVYGINVSSATIRNELHELEKEGYLDQPHTSSGRIPTDKGYRFFVNDLMPKEFQTVISPAVALKLQSIGKGIEDTLIEVSDILSSLINYTTIVLTPDVYQETLKVAHLILVDLVRVLVVLLNSAGINSEFLVHIQERLTQDQLNRLSELLTRKLGGKPFHTFNPQIWEEIVQELPDLRHVIGDLGQSIQRLIEQQVQHERLLTKGFSNMIKLPEFKNIELTQKVLTTLEESKALVAILNESLRLTTSNVSIGSEIDHNNLQECSLISSPYKIDNEPAGVIGVLGPKRMNYSLIVPMVSEISQMVSRYLSDAIKKERGDHI